MRLLPLLKLNLISSCGDKIILMSSGNIRFLDSINYFSLPLSELLKAFGLEKLKKGYFPHLFNKEQNYKYVGILPNIKYYDPDN